MVPEIGHFALILALAVAIIQCGLPVIGAARGDVAPMEVARPGGLSSCSSPQRSSDLHPRRSENR